MSELLHGDINGFIINAYLAIQHQWPDEGGFRHYHYMLVTQPEARPRVLRELALSTSAKRIGTELEDDLPPDLPYDPANNDLSTYLRVTQKLQLLHVIHDARDLREAVSRITLEGISEAVQLVVETAMGSLAQMDSRIAQAEADVTALRQVVAGAALGASTDEPVAPAVPAALSGGDDPERAWLRHEVLRLGRRLHMLEQHGVPGAAPADASGVAAPRAGVPQIGRLEGELADLRNVVMPLHQFTTVDLKRHLADYVNALVLAHANATTFDPPGFPVASTQKVDDVL
ncbi:MAG TPA: hypothetical protein VLA61_20825 [Ideonella sp.]|uniref:hypothetical protein n=1 Tax=Ideonella sp. TaxID=1929293 RepID=UPI002CC0691D|nr:hypothetical protein [Ideonella sp.]HSI50721.1 hypothetical protein [Ideonella sp.]